MRESRAILRDIRERVFSCTQETLARKLGYSEEHVCRLETGSSGNHVLPRHVLQLQQIRPPPPLELRPLFEMLIAELSEAVARESAERAEERRRRRAGAQARSPRSPAPSPVPPPEPVPESAPSAPTAPEPPASPRPTVQVQPEAASTSHSSAALTTSTVTSSTLAATALVITSSEGTCIQAAVPAQTTLQLPPPVLSLATPAVPAAGVPRPSPTSPEDSSTVSGPTRAPTVLAGLLTCSCALIFLTVLLLVTQDGAPAYVYVIPETPAEGASIIQTVRMGKKAPIKRYLVPPKPFKGQKVAPCSAAKGEVEINGGCWIPIDYKAPCPEDSYEHKGKCYRPIQADPNEPVVFEEFDGGSAQPSLQDYLDGGAESR